jgi:hypothetical protein
MGRARRRVAIGALAITLTVGAGVTAPASGAIKVTRDSRNNVLAQFKDVNCRLQGLDKPLVLLARGHEGGWGFRVTIYDDKIRREHGYKVRYGNNSRADVVVNPPNGPRFTNENKPQPGNQDPFGVAGGVVLTKKTDNRLGVGLPTIYDGTGSSPKHVTVSGYANCK